MSLYERLCLYGAMGVCNALLLGLGVSLTAAVIPLVVAAVLIVVQR